MGILMTIGVILLIAFLAVVYYFLSKYQKK